MEKLKTFADIFKDVNSQIDKAYEDNIETLFIERKLPDKAEFPHFDEDDYKHLIEDAKVRTIDKFLRGLESRLTVKEYTDPRGDTRFRVSMSFWRGSHNMHRNFEVLFWDKCQDMFKLIVEMQNEMKKLEDNNAEGKQEV